MILDFLKNENLKDGGIFIIMCGPPGSGKSTLANTICENYDNFVIISPDKIREELTGDSSNQMQNDIVFARVYGQLNAYLENGQNVIYDATNCRSQYRYKIMNTVQHTAKKIFCLMATTPIGECLSRNSNRGRYVPDNVIEKMYFNLRNHPPVIFEGYDAIIRF